ncbi:alkene reductase [Cupriavidus necator]|uniref:alkene reductase n=1 Tax=Cupriavidus necator TaxID=106590 RepID=UPI0039C4CBE4
MSKLFSTVKVGAYEISHRVVMAPVSRMRAADGAIPTPLMATYYGQRASKGGFMLTEAAAVAMGGNGYLGSPGIYDDSQIAGWRLVTQAVHAKGARIFMQLYHAGRQSHAELQPDGGVPVGPSAIPHSGVAHIRGGWVPATPNRALELHEIADIVESFRVAAQRAVEAGFDGVELYAANGYLFDQFLQDGSNKRTDIYGGSLENRARLLVETIRAVLDVVGDGKLGVRLSPSGVFNDVSDSDPVALFTYVAQELAKFDLAYVHIIEPRITGAGETEGANPDAIAARHIRKHYPGTIIAAGGFTGSTAQEIVDAGDADLVAFGRHFVANPDLPERLRRNLPLNAYDRETFSGGTEVGYTDYPFYGEETQAAA